MRPAAGATPDAKGRAIDFDYFGRHKRMRADAKMHRATGDALTSVMASTILTADLHYFWSIPGGR
jgi:hypothetical protein